MRLAIVISIFISAILWGCSTEDKATPKVVLNDPTLNNSSSGTTTTTTAASSQEVYTNFVRLAFKSSDGKQTMTIRKWQPTITQVKVFWDGGSDATMLKYLDKLIADINTLSKSNKFVRTTTATGAHVIINRTTADAHGKKYTQFKVSNANMSGETYTVWGGTGIQQAVIWVSPSTQTALVQGIIRHELLHGLGLGHTESTKSIMVAVMNSSYYDFSNFSILDKSIISILQDPRVKHGGSETEASAVIKEYAAKASSMREIANENATQDIEGIIKCNFIEVKND